MTTTVVIIIVILAVLVWWMRKQNRMLHFHWRLYAKEYDDDNEASLANEGVFSAFNGKQLAVAELHTGTSMWESPWLEAHGPAKSYKRFRSGSDVYIEISEVSEDFVLGFIATHNSPTSKPYSATTWYTR